jgi:hypothetical protein
MTDKTMTEAQATLAAIGRLTALEGLVHQKLFTLKSQLYGQFEEFDVDEFEQEFLRYLDDAGDAAA